MIMLTGDSSRSRTARDGISAIEKLHEAMLRYDINHNRLLRTGKISQALVSAVKILLIKSECIEKHSPEDNDNIESFDNFLKADRPCSNKSVWHHLESNTLVNAFSVCNEWRPHLSIEYIPPREFQEEILEFFSSQGKFR